MDQQLHLNYSIRPTLNRRPAQLCMGRYRDLFYRNQELVGTSGIDSQINQSHQATNLQYLVDQTAEQSVEAYAIELSAYDS